MIVLHITERVKPTVITYPATNWKAPTPQQPAANAELFKEIQRRDKVIKDLVRDFKHVVGSKVTPAREEDEKEWGVCQVIAICTEYIHLEKDHKWPKNDNPMIVTCFTEHGEIFNATTNYFK